MIYICRIFKVRQPDIAIYSSCYSFERQWQSDSVDSMVFQWKFSMLDKFFTATASAMAIAMFMDMEYNGREGSESYSVYIFIIFDKSTVKETEALSTN